MNGLARFITTRLGRGDFARGRELQADLSDLFQERRQRRGAVLAMIRWTWDLASLMVRPRSALAGRRSVAVLGLLPDVGYGWRHWRRRPRLAAVAALTLGLGMAASATTYSVVNGVLLRPLSYPESERLVVVWNTYPGWRGHPILGGEWDTVSLSWPEYIDARNNARSIEALGLYSPRRAAVADDAGAYEIDGGVVTASFLRLLGARAIQGRLFTDAEDESASDAVVISHEFWQARLGSRPGVVGETLQLNADTATIVGVLEPGFSHRGEAFWRPVGVDAAENRDRGLHVYEAVALLAPTADVEVAAAELGPILRAGRSPEQQSARVESLLERRVGAARTPLLVILVAGGLLLVVACANVSGLLVGDLTSRRSEISLRAALGASRWRLAREVVGAGLVLAMLSVGLGVCLAYSVMPTVLRFLPADTPRADLVTIDLGVLAVAAVVGLGATLLFSLGPLALLGRGDLQHAMRQGGRGAVRGWRLQAGLAAAEVALAVVLLSGAGLLVRTFSELTNVDPGFRATGLVTARLSPPAWRYQTAEAVSGLYEATLARIRAMPGVTDATTVSILPFADGGSSSSIGLRSLPENGPEPEAQRRVIAPAYFQTLGIPLLEGRPFVATDTRDTPYATVVSESLANQLFAGDAVGEEIEWDDEWFTIVGVVGDIRYDDLGADEQPTFYVSTTQVGALNLRIAVHTDDDPAVLAGNLAALVRSVDSQVVVSDIARMPGLIENSLEDERFRTALVSSFAALALLLCGIGIYAASARSVAERRREIGVRMALGARARDVTGLVVRQGAMVVALGLVVGVGASAVAVRWVRSFLFGVSAADPIMLGSVAVLLAVLVVASTAIPARRAAGIDPADTIRES